LERERCHEAGGIQDQIAASFGGLNRIDMDRNGYVVKPIIISNQRKAALNERLMLFFTGFTRFSADIQKGTNASVHDKQQQLLTMKSMVDEAEKILISKGYLSDFGKLLNESWKLKRGLSAGVSTDSIDAIYQEALKAGAVGGKLLGAGGGGFLLFYVEPEKQPSVRKALDKLLYVPFMFENTGTTIIYYAAEDYEIE
jgi:D-glycero-alpha-D-manno-heptose-7-phosphate kinase